MEPDFWHEKWASNEIGFHQSQPNPLLVAHFRTLGLRVDAQVFVPLCGKSHDMTWLLSQGFKVVGAELSENAVTAYFEELNVTPAVSEQGPLKLFEHDNIRIFAGDIFELTKQALGDISAIYDRAALVALPETLRARYAEHLMSITRTAPQFLICFEYDQSHMSGPPFSVSDAAVSEYYGDQYEMNLLSKTDVEGGLKGHCKASENVWYLSSKTL